MSAFNASGVARRSITLVTGNPNKLKEVVRIVGDSFPLTSHSVDLPELQGDPREISAEKCRLAADAIDGPVIVEDTSLCFNALGGMPGPYIKWFLDSCGHDGLNRMLAGFDDKTAYAQCIFSLSWGKGQEPITFVGRTAGRIVPARGPPDFGWDPVFEPDESGGKTYAEMDKTAKDAISHRFRSLDKLKAYLESDETAQAHLKKMAL